MSLCWTVGDNTYNQQCDTSSSTVPRLKLIKPCKQIKHIVTGNNGSTYILSEDDKLIVFGNNCEKQLGISNHTFIFMIISHYSEHLWFIPYDILLLIVHFCVDAFSSKFHYNKYDEKTHCVPIELFTNKIKLISNGITSNHKFIITMSNEMYGIGWNIFHQLGIQTYNKSALNIISFFSKNNIKIKRIECGYAFSTFLTVNGKLYVSGWSYDGALGLGSDIEKVHTFTMIKCIEHLNIKQICTGDEHTLALDENGAIYSWGHGGNGQLGHGNESNVYSPKQLEYFKGNVAMIACGSDHNVILDKNGFIYCFGRNSEYQCGNNSNQDVLRPVLNETLKNMNVIDIKCGYNHSCIETTEHGYFLWGYNQYNQCLVFDINAQYIKIPMEFTGCNNQMFGKILTIYPGFYETRIITQQKY